MRKTLLFLPVVVYVVATLIANYDLFPRELISYWWFDNIGHIVVYAALTLTACVALKQTTWSWWYGPLAVLVLATTDELLQLMLINRTFTFEDWVMSVIGIVLAVIGYWRWQKKNERV